MGFLTSINWDDLTTDTSFTCSFVDTTVDGLVDVQPPAASTTLIGFNIPDLSNYPYYVQKDGVCYSVDDGYQLGKFDRTTMSCILESTIYLSHSRNNIDLELSDLTNFY